LISDTKSKTVSSENTDVWIISEGRNVDVDLSAIEAVPDKGTLKEYRISDIARYMLNPNSIEIKKRLIGCEIHLRKRRLTRFKETVSKIFPMRIRRWLNANPLPPEVFISNCKLKIPYLKDRGLAAHIDKIYELLRSYDTLTKNLLRLNHHKIAHIIGICEDIGGNLSYLKLQGGIEEKIKYMATYISKNVGVVLRKAYQAEGLFELRGFDFESYKADNVYRLITFLTDGKPKLCVMDPDDNLDFWVDDSQLLKYLHLLEHSIKANPNLKKAFYLCRTRQAKAVKLFFNKKLEIDYSKTHFPKVYREVFSAHNVASNQRNLVMPSLNYLLIGVSLNYVPLSDSGEDQLYTHISVLHDLRALESLKNNLPQVYSEISKGAFISEVGRFYLLDSIEGHSNV
jgi:hypothetical protein